MQKRVRFILFGLSFLLFLIFLWFLILAVYPTLSIQIQAAMLLHCENIIFKGGLIFVILLGIAISVYLMIHAVFSNRMKRTILKCNEIGCIEVGTDAIQSIALNAATLAQVGVKSAKAQVASTKDATVNILMIVVLYSDVEIQSQMSVLQDRVKKDVQRYTGLVVSKVEIKVARVERIGAKIER